MFQKNSYSRSVEGWTLESWTLSTVSEAEAEGRKARASVDSHADRIDPDQYILINPNFCLSVRKVLHYSWSLGRKETYTVFLQSGGKSTGFYSTRSQKYRVITHSTRLCLGRALRGPHPHRCFLQHLFQLGIFLISKQSRIPGSQDWQTILCCLSDQLK